MKSDEGVVHAVVRHAISPSIQAPTALTNISRSLSHHDAQARWSTVENDAFDHLFAPRARP